MNSARSKTVQGRAFAGYFPGGYPGVEASLELMQKTAGEIDIFEIGYPSYDPYLDGDMIKNAHKKALERGTPDRSYWRRLREIIRGPLWIMAYKKDFIDSGVYRDFAEDGLADMLVLPDCSDRERLELRAELARTGLDVMGFAGPQTPPEQFRIIAQGHQAIYFQRYVGKTGSAVTEEDPSAYLEMIRSFPSVKLYAGFGINSGAQARRLVEQGFDGVIVGTALIRALEESEEQLMKLIRDISASINASIHNVRSITNKR
jgi:tryptophan synthase alpha chain